MHCSSPCQSVDRVMIRALVAGDLEPTTLRQCPTNDLETLLLKVLETRTEKPVWWPEELLPFDHIGPLRKHVRGIIMSWHSALTVILGSYVRYLSSLQQTPQPKNVPTLAPSPTNETCSSPTPSTRLRTPYVVVKDVLKCKYPVLEKSDYMHRLKLQPTGLTPPLVTDGAEPRVRTRYAKRLPFSSMLGQKLLSNDNATNYKGQQSRRTRNGDGSGLRAGSTDTSSSDAPAQFTKLIKKKQWNRDRIYKFPKRQQTQWSNATERMRQAFCRPVEVRLKRLNIQPYLIKRQMCRRVSVGLDRSVVDAFMDVTD